MNLWNDVFRNLRIPLLLTLIIALGFEFTLYTGIDNSVFGIHPMDLKRLYGIVTVPLVHGNVAHLLNNLFAFAALSSLLYVVYDGMAGKVMSVLWLLTGTGMFLFARSEYYHIGASGVVYALIFFLSFAGFLARTRTTVVVSLIVIFYYGGSIWGVFPLQEQVSWDGHLAGALTGMLTAGLFHRKIRSLHPGDAKPDWYEDEEDGDDGTEPDPYEQFGTNRDSK